MIKIILLNDDYRAKWDQYIEKSPEGTFYHLTCWKSVIEKSFGFKAIYLAALDSDKEVIGILPLFLMKNILGKNHLISTPSSIYAGICANSDQARNELINKAREVAKENNVQYIEIRQLGAEIIDLPTIKDFVTMTLEVESDEEEVWKNSLKSVTRNRIRKAYKGNLSVEFGKNYLDDFYRVFSVNMRDLGTPVYPKQFFKNILEICSKYTNIIVVKHQNSVIGAMFYISFKEVFINPWVSSLRKFNNLCPNELLYWEAIKFACKNNLRQFDFGRSTIDSGTFNFKKKWGAKPQQLYYQYFLNNSQSMPEVSTNNNQYQLAIDLWKKLPLSVSNILGPRLVRYLPEF